MNASTDVYCITCGYLLRSLPENRCPECGRAFNLADPTTFAHRRHPNQLYRWLVRPLGWPSHLLTLMVVALTLWAWSVPGEYFELALMSLLGWAALGLIWLLRILIRLPLLQIYGPIQQSRSRLAYWWAIAPAFALLTFVLLSMRAPVWVRFQVSYPWIHKLVTDASVLLPTQTTMPDRRLGMYHAENIEVIPGGVQFMIKGAGFIDRYGFAYSPRSTPQPHNRYYYKPFIKDWYSVMWKF